MSVTFDWLNECAALRARCARMALAMATASAWLVLGCSRSDPEKELRAAIDSIATNIEQQRVADALTHVSDDFSRESGAFGKADARRLLAAAMLRNEKIRVVTTISDLRIDGERAFVKFRVVATGGAGLLPERGQTWEFDSAWRREGGQWRVYNAEWREDL